MTWILDDGTTYPQQLHDGERGAQEITVPSGASTSTLQLRIDATTLPGDAGFDYTAISDLTVMGR